MQVSGTIQGVKELQARFSKSPILMEQAARETLTAATLVAEGAAKENAPIDQGILRGSIHSRVSRLNGETVGIVGTNIEYAPYQENGTGIYGPRATLITPKRSRFLRFKTKSGQIVFARSVRGSRPKKFMAKGMKAVQSNLAKIRQIGLLAVKKKLGF
jgi:phage gpG-like protein